MGDQFWAVFFGIGALFCLLVLLRRYPWRTLQFTLLTVTGLVLCIVLAGLPLSRCLGW